MASVEHRGDVIVITGWRTWLLDLRLMLLPASEAVFVDTSPKNIEKEFSDFIFYIIHNG